LNDLTDGVRLALLWRTALFDARRKGRAQAFWFAKLNAFTAGGVR